MPTARYVAALCNIVGCFIRCLEYFVDPVKYGFWIVLFGSLIVAFGQAPLLIGAPKLTALWFADDERNVSTSIGALSNLVGMGMAYVLGPPILKHYNFHVLFLVQLGFALIFNLPTILFFRERPKLPPSTSNHDENMSNVGQAFKTVFRIRGFVCLFFGFGLGFGLFATLFTVLSQIVTSIPKYTYTQTDAGWFGVIMIGGGIIGAGIFGTILDKYKTFKTCLIITFICTIFAFFSLYLSMYSTFSYPKTWISVALSCGVIGFFAISALPISMESAVEVCYPLPEASVSGILMLGGNLFSIIVTVIVSIIDDGKIQLEFMIGCLFICIFFMFFFKGPYQRMEFESAHKYTVFQ